MHAEVFIRLIQVRLVQDVVWVLRRLYYPKDYDNHFLQTLNKKNDENDDENDDDKNNDELLILELKLEVFNYDKVKDILSRRGRPR